MRSVGKSTKEVQDSGAKQLIRKTSLKGIDLGEYPIKSWDDLSSPKWISSNTWLCWNYKGEKANLYISGSLISLKRHASGE